MINIKERTLKGMKFIDLFAGLGGFRIALESLGAKCVYSNEWDEPVQKVYAENFGEIPEGDITQVDENTIPDHDILCAGFPCQPFSISGKQRGFEDSRGTLFFDVARIVKAKNPKIVFMENVKTTYMPVGQAVRTNYKSMKVEKFLRNNKLTLIIGGIVIALLSSYAVLIINFINLIKIIK